MTIFDFLAWALGIVFIGLPAVCGVIVILIVWIESRSSKQWRSQYPPATEEPEEEV